MKLMKPWMLAAAFELSACGLSACRSIPPAGTASNVPRSDDPKACEDGPSPKEIAKDAQARELRQTLDTTFSKLGYCLNALHQKNAAYASLRLEVGADTKVAKVWTLRSTLSQCQPLSCISRALTGIQAPKGSANSNFFDTIRLVSNPPRIKVVADDNSVNRVTALMRQHAGTCEDRDVPEDGGRLPPEVIQRIVRSRYGAFRECYTAALARNPKAQGQVRVRFVINREGTVSSVRVEVNTLPDCTAVRCIRDSYRSLRFPQPEGGIVTVVYPIMFSPG